MNAAEPTGSSVPLKEFIERIIAENNIRRDDLRAEDRRWIEQKFESINKALELQATEYERRMTALNHEAMRLLKAVEITVSRDTWDGFQKEYSALEKRVTSELADRTGKGKSLPLVISVLSVAIAAVALLAAYFSRH